MSLDRTGVSLNRLVAFLSLLGEREKGDLACLACLASVGIRLTAIRSRILVAKRHQSRITCEDPFQPEPHPCGFSLLLSPNLSLSPCPMLSLFFHNPHMVRYRTRHTGVPHCQTIRTRILALVIVVEVDVRTRDSVEVNVYVFFGHQLARPSPMISAIKRADQRLPWTRQRHWMLTVQTLNQVHSSTQLVENKGKAFIAMRLKRARPCSTDVSLPQQLDCPEVNCTSIITFCSSVAILDVAE